MRSEENPLHMGRINWKRSVPKLGESTHDSQEDIVRTVDELDDLRILANLEMERPYNRPRMPHDELISEIRVADEESHFLALQESHPPSPSCGINIHSMSHPVMGVPRGYGYDDSNSVMLGDRSGPNLTRVQPVNRNTSLLPANDDTTNSGVHSTLEIHVLPDVHQRPWNEGGSVLPHETDTQVPMARSTNTDPAPLGQQFHVSLTRCNRRTNNQPFLAENRFPSINDASGTSVHQIADDFSRNPVCSVASSQGKATHEEVSGCNNNIAYDENVSDLTYAFPQVGGSNCRVSELDCSKDEDEDEGSSDSGANSELEECRRRRPASNTEHPVALQSGEHQGINSSSDCSSGYNQSATELDSVLESKKIGLLDKSHEGGPRTGLVQRMQKHRETELRASAKVIQRLPGALSEWRRTRERVALAEQSFMRNTVGCLCASVEACASIAAQTLFARYLWAAWQTVFRQSDLPAEFYSRLMTEKVEPWINLDVCARMINHESYQHEEPLWEDVVSDHVGRLNDMREKQRPRHGYEFSWAAVNSGHSLTVPKCSALPWETGNVCSISGMCISLFWDETGVSASIASTVLSWWLLYRLIWIVAFSALT